MNGYINTKMRRTLCKETKQLGLKISKSTNIIGQVLVDTVNETDETVQQQVAYMNANIQEGDSVVNINKSIQNRDLFSVNKDTVLADFKSFEDTVYDILNAE